GNTIQAPVHIPVNACGNSVNVAALLNQASDNSCGGASGGGASSTGAHATGTTAGSPGVASGNTIQAPVHIPVNACGNSVNVAALLNQASDNSCGTGGPKPPQTPPQTVPQTPPQTVPQTPPQTVPQTPPQTVPQTPPQTVPQTPPQTVPQTPPQTVPQTPPRTVPQTPPHVPSQTPPHHEPGITPAGAPVTPAHPAPALARTGSEGVIAASAVSVAMLTGGLILYRRGRVASRF
ncbi:chaplin, partial [Streptomyces sp. NPDC002513]